MVAVGDMPPENFKKEFRLHRERLRTGHLRQRNARLIRPKQDAVARVGIHRDEPRLAIAPMRHDPRLARRVPRGLRTRLGQVEVLNPFHLDVQPGQGSTHDVRAVCATGELLAAPRIKTVLTKQCRKFALAA